MLSRRTLAFYTAVFLLTTAFFRLLPSAPRLVCQFTGEPMAAVITAPVSDDRKEAAAVASCCNVSSQATAGGAKRLALTNPGCCELQQGAERADLPVAVLNVAPDFADAAVLASLPQTPRPFVSDFRITVAVAGESAPRAPPQRAASSRGPPFVS